MQFSVQHYPSVTSTMDVARRRALEGAPEGTLVVADEQTAGRGRGDHNWYSPPNQSLYVSIVLRPTLQPAQASWITMVTALAVREICADLVADATAHIKWFNDVLLNSRKVCGILVESSITGDMLDYAILGIGLNVNTTFTAAPPDVQARATSLLVELKRASPIASMNQFDLATVLANLQHAFSKRYVNLLRERSSPAPEYALHLDTLGRDVRISVGDEVIAGRALRIADDGALIVQTLRGEERIGFGEII